MTDRHPARETRHVKLSKAALQKIARLKKRLEASQEETFDFRPVSIGTVIEYALGRCSEKGDP